MTYAEKLKDPRWQKKRLEALEAAGWECSYCGDKEHTLNVHHRLYRTGVQPWDYEDFDLEVLCNGCHTNKHKKMQVIMELLSDVNTAIDLDYVIGFLRAQHWGGPDPIDSGPYKPGNYEEVAGYLVGCGSKMTPDEYLRLKWESNG